MPADNGRTELLEQLRSDQRARWEHGEAVRAEEYLAKNPALQCDQESALELIYHEVVLREEAGQRPKFEEYAERFPHLADKLKPVFEVHQAIEAAGNTDPFPTQKPDVTCPAMPSDDDATRRVATSESPSADPYATIIPDATIPAPKSKTPIGGRFVLPGYEILDELGKGGMGVVYKARQVGLNRIVALKMILGGDLVGREEVERFRLEAEAVAKLAHPNIVAVYEIGEMHGRPYFSLEFMESGSLADKLTGTPLRARQAARLIQTLADAVQYAHEHGIVHRDLKPANILLKEAEERERKSVLKNTLFSLETLPPTEGRRLFGGRLSAAGERERRATQRTAADGPGASTSRLIPDERLLIPKITDFGLAKKVGDDSGRTRTGTIMGTPSYMAPEQAEGRTKEIGPPADIYALGAIFYELLTGRPPFRAETALETIRQVVSFEPVAPRTLQPHLARDLETICLKCLQKDQHRRYATAGELAEDLRRFLANEPIKARPVSVLVRAAKWARRRPAWAGLIVLGAALFVSAPVVAVRERLHAEQRQRDKVKVDASFRAAMQAVDDMLREAGEVDLEDAPHMEQARKRLLEKAQGFYDRFLEDHGDDPDPVLRREAARARSRLGDVRFHLGENAAAVEAYQRALAVLKPLTEETPYEPEPRQEFARAHARLGIVLKKLNDFSRAEAELRQGLQVYQQLVAEYPEEPEYQQDLGNAQYFLGVILAPVTGRREQAEQMYRNALRIQEPLVRRPSDRPDYRRELARTLNNLGILTMQSRSPETEALFTRARDLQQDLVQRQPGVANYKRELARTQSNLGNWLVLDKRIPPALAAYRAAEKLLSELVSSFPTVPEYQAEHAIVLSNLGKALQAGDPRKAEEVYERALAVRTKLAEDFPTVPEYRHGLGLQYVASAKLLAAQKRTDEAEHAYREALNIQRALVEQYGDVHEYRHRYGATQNNLARVLYDRGRLAERDQKGALGLLACWCEPVALAAWIVEQRTCLPRARQLVYSGMAEQRRALLASPQSAAYLLSLTDDFQLLALIALELGDHAAAADAAAELPRLQPSQLGTHQRAAMFLCACINQVADDSRLSAPQRLRASEGYAVRAVAILNRALKRDEFATEDLQRLLKTIQTAPNFEPLRARDDFRRLLDGLEGKLKSAVE